MRSDWHDSISDSEPHVICSATTVDDLYGPAGINRPAGATFAVNDRRLEFVSGSLDGCASNFTAEEYLLDFQNWIVATHPELTNRIVNAPWQSTLWIPCTPYPFRNADGAREVIALVDEFIAQSDRWPINQ